MLKRDGDLFSAAPPPSGRGGLPGCGAPDPAPHPAAAPLPPGSAPRGVAGRPGPRRSEIKRVLLDQTVVSGIGNIYADEALWSAQIHPHRRASGMRQRDVVHLLDCAAGTMLKALEAGGTSFDDLYVNVNGASGYFSRSLHVYGRTGLPCHRCGTPIERTVTGGRSSHFCPECQRRGRRRPAAGPQSRALGSEL
ncbi:zinc finger domain-containing protein [Corynebacterium provencense]|uniref:zinc finger domain-containing protein n=1 Tax=Corynebacterium provencense TaxID=1737425 RepID=UPI00098ED9B7